MELRLRQVVVVLVAVNLLHTMDKAGFFSLPPWLNFGLPTLSLALALTLFRRSA